MNHITNTLDGAIVFGVTDFSGGWDTFWSTLTGAVPGLETLMNILGVILVVLSLFGYFWQHRKGTNWPGGTQSIVGSLILGSLLLAPAVVFPILLGLADWLISFFYNMFSDPLPT